MQEREMSLPRRRLTQDLNSPSRINLLGNSQKRMQEKHLNPSRGVTYDPWEIMDTSFEIAPTSRRTIELNEIIDGQDSSRRRPDLRDYNTLNQGTTTDRGNWEDKERLYFRERISMDEKLERYKSQLENMVIEYEKLKRIRTTEQQTALENHAEWAEAKDKAYLTLRDQFEEFAHNKTSVIARHHSNNKYEEQNEELKATVSRLEQQLEQKTAELNNRNRISSSSKLDHQPVFELYEDLTGVIVTGVKSTDTGNQYKCVIAGKNGTFEFSLSVSKEKDGPVFYSPVLKDDRDSKLISILPEFLKEDVSFQRDNIPTFFWRLSSIIN